MMPISTYAHCPERALVNASWEGDFTNAKRLCAFCKGSARDSFGATALMAACSSGHHAIAAMLLNLCDPIAKCLLTEQTALHWAAKNSRPLCCELLAAHPVARQAASMRDTQGRTPLMLASAAGDLPSVRLLARFDRLSRDNMGLDALEIASQSGQLGVCKVLCSTDQGRIAPWRAAAIAAQNGHRETANFLAERCSAIDEMLRIETCFRIEPLQKKTRARAL